jgi:hypothetical protein
VSVAHICNPSYSGGRDQEDRSWKPPWANSSARPYLEKTHHKNRAGGVKTLSSRPGIKPPQGADFQFFNVVTFYFILLTF